jgi:hypothetical protein
MELGRQSHSTNHEVSRLQLKPEAYYLIQKIPCLIYPSQINPIYTQTYYFVELQLNMASYYA